MSEKSAWEIFSEECPRVSRSFQELSREANVHGALDEKTLLLVLVGIYSATRDPGALRHFVAEAFRTGASKHEIEAASLLPFSVGVSSAEMSIPIIVDVAKKMAKP